MVLDLDVFDDDLKAVIADLPVVVVWKGQTFNGMADGEQRSNEVVEEGFFESRDRDLQIALSDLDDPAVFPQVNKTLTVDGQAYRITRTGRSADKKALLMTLSRLER